MPSAEAGTAGRNSRLVRRRNKSAPYPAAFQSQGPLGCGSRLVEFSLSFHIISSPSLPHSGRWHRSAGCRRCCVLTPLSVIPVSLAVPAARDALPYVGDYADAVWCGSGNRKETLCEFMADTRATAGFFSSSSLSSNPDPLLCRSLDPLVAKMSLLSRFPFWSVG
ncbi:hypothetical protein B296_00027271 [Ensete ventricosum]|uniref:Uncharacterized protein n=1 Tax=Ensete ventricosum TaxID=4639 RepID=A0A426YIV7_ENSVE|nr:hypothetical protein B296_00027271 [Ensete ventricosum]